MNVASQRNFQQYQECTQIPESNECMGTTKMCLGTPPPKHILDRQKGSQGEKEEARQ